MILDHNRNYSCNFSDILKDFVDVKECVQCIVLLKCVGMHVSLKLLQIKRLFSCEMMSTTREKGLCCTSATC